MSTLFSRHGINAQTYLKQV